MLRGGCSRFGYFVYDGADIAVPAHPHYGATFQSGRFASESRAY